MSEPDYRDGLEEGWRRGLEEGFRRGLSNPGGAVRAHAHPDNAGARAPLARAARSHAAALAASDRAICRRRRKDPR